MKRVTLTFDNGPTPGVTEGILELLSARNIRTTFFVIGEKLTNDGGLAVAKRAHALGHWIGNHSFTHSAPLGDRPGLDYAQQEIEVTQDLLGELSHADKLFRPMGGGGAIGPHLLSRAALQLLQAEKYTCVLWSSVPGDWKDPEGWVDRCIEEIAARDWAVVVLHDIQNAALARLAEFLDRLENIGVEIRQNFPDDVIFMMRGELLFSDDSTIVT
ncbi:MAG TPA: polysaccharide deacetylase family protein [Candidatus Saccharimonadales bacterium]|jgi:peptidoglycan/xylan/chitin deacetylase (PgdA/CDA1 family)|nr:polysaccharide deacetylase family protein [Candidatus Saccharimonadales bacterium]